jgi:hypothetical protein
MNKKNRGSIRRRLASGETHDVEAGLGAVKPPRFQHSEKLGEMGPPEPRYIYFPRGAMFPTVCNDLGETIEKVGFFP